MVELFVGAALGVAFVHLAQGLRGLIAAMERRRDHARGVPDFASIRSRKGGR